MKLRKSAGIALVVVAAAVILLNVRHLAASTLFWDVLPDENPVTHALLGLAAWGVAVAVVVAVGVCLDETRRVRHTSRRHRYSLSWILPGLVVWALLTPVVHSLLIWWLAAPENEREISSWWEGYTVHPPMPEFACWVSAGALAYIAAFLIMAAANAGIYRRKLNRAIAKNL